MHRRLFCCLLLLLVSTALFAQQTGAIHGRVTATDGSVQLTASAELDDSAPERAGEAVARLLEGEGAASLLAR